jgi:hypothetical protein
VLRIKTPLGDYKVDEGLQYYCNWKQKHNSSALGLCSKWILEFSLQDKLRKYSSNDVPNYTSELKLGYAALNFMEMLT